MSAICKFNSYCKELEELYDPAWSIPLPRPLPTKLNDLSNDQSLMEDVWITPTEGQVPHWMEDQAVRDGMRAMLKHKRASRNSASWASKRTICADEKEILSLRSRWPNLLVSAPRFESQTTEATVLSLWLSGGSPKVSLFWVNPIMVETPDVAPEEADVISDPVFSSHKAACEPEEAVLLDYLTEGALVSVDEDEAVERPMIPVEIMENITFDVTPVPGRTRVVHGDLEATRLAMLSSPTVWLNDWCINGCIALLFTAIQPARALQVATLSTHELPRIQRDTPDHKFWRATSWTRFWTKDLWIIPIHRPAPENHWVLCIANFSRRELRLFDSFAQQKLWESDILDVMRLITRLLTIVKWKYPTNIRVDYRPWVAYPTTSLPVQTNGDDCGVWVLATIAAVLRGFDATGLQEVEIADFRRSLYHLMLALPTLS
ncbi:hypothetical protein JVU11DRAFT_10190 [Chiua virens]|nr:hypothetical protein JVU11DRAFT_10190 [Chiua virens]